MKEHDIDWAYRRAKAAVLRGLGKKQYSGDLGRLLFVASVRWDRDHVKYYDCDIPRVTENQRQVVQLVERVEARRKKATKR